jgi:hypothetical protein
MKKTLLALATLFLFAGVAAADTLTPRVGMTKPDINSPNWGPKLNKDFDIADSSFVVIGGTTPQTIPLVNSTTVTVSGRVIAPVGSVSIPSIQVGPNSNTGVYSRSPGYIDLTAGGTLVMEGTSGSMSSLLPFDAVGSSNNSDAGVGSIGEYSIVDVPSGSAVPAMPGNATFSMATMTVTAGDWDMTACFQVYAGGSSASTVISVGMATTPGGGPTAGNGGITSTIPMANLQQQGFCVGPKRYRSSSTINVYACGYITYTGATPLIWGSIRARRIR